MKLLLAIGAMLFLLGCGGVAASPPGEDAAVSSLLDSIRTDREEHERRIQLHVQHNKRNSEFLNAIRGYWLDPSTGEVLKIKFNTGYRFFRISYKSNRNSPYEALERDTVTNDWLPVYFNRAGARVQKPYLLKREQDKLVCKNPDGSLQFFLSVDSATVRCTECKPGAKPISFWEGEYAVHAGCCVGTRFSKDRNGNYILANLDGAECRHWERFGTVIGYDSLTWTIHVKTDSIIFTETCAEIYRKVLPISSNDSTFYCRFRFSTEDMVRIIRIENSWSIQYSNDITRGDDAWVIDSTNIDWGTDLNYGPYF